MVGPLETGKLQLIPIRQKNGTFHSKFDKIDFFINIPNLFTIYAKEIENLEFVRGVNFEIIDSLKNNFTKYLLIFDDYCAESCISKAFVDIATARRNRGLSTVYSKHYIFHQSKLGRDVELQSTHTVLFKSPGDVMQVTTFSTQLGLGSELVESYREAASVPFGQGPIDLLCYRRSVTFLYKHRIYSPRSLYPGPAETAKNFWQWTHKISPLSKCSNYVLTTAKIFSFSLAQKSLSGFFANA